jgi:hypothetical protein
VVSISPSHVWHFCGSANLGCVEFYDVHVYPV